MGKWDECEGRPWGSGGIHIGIPSYGPFTERRILPVLNYELRIANYELRIDLASILTHSASIFKYYPKIYN